MATYGEGDPTDNAQDFYDWLQENDDEDLSGLNYTVSPLYSASPYIKYKYAAVVTNNINKCFVIYIGDMAKCHL